MLEPATQLPPPAALPSVRTSIAIVLVLVCLFIFVLGAGYGFLFEHEGSHPVAACNHLDDRREFRSCFQSERRKTGFDVALGWWKFAAAALVLAGVITVPDFVWGANFRRGMRSNED